MPNNLLKVVLMNHDKEFIPPLKNKAIPFCKCDKSLLCWVERATDSNGFPGRYDFVYTDLSEDELLQFINSLDGLTQSTYMACFHKNDKEYLAVVGGYGNWFITWIVLDASRDVMLDLINYDNIDGEPRFVECPYADEHMPWQVVQRDDLKKIVLHYAETGLPHPDYYWQLQGTTVEYQSGS